MSFGWMELPFNLTNLSQLQIMFSETGQFNFSNFSRFVEKMPELEIINIFAYIDDRQILQIVSGVALAATSQRKNVIVKNLFFLGKGSMNLNILQNDERLPVFRKLICKISNTYCSGSETLVNGVKKVLQEAGRNCQVYVSKVEY